VLTPFARASTAPPRRTGLALKRDDAPASTDVCHALAPIGYCFAHASHLAAHLAAADLSQINRAVKRKLKLLQYRPEVINGCLAGTGLVLEA
jgi:hypothetical protein